MTKINLLSQNTRTAVRFSVNARNRPLLLPWGWPCGLRLVMLLAVLAAAGSAQALGFGKNKLHTRELDWQVFETDHFEIHYYPEEEAVAREVCQIAEGAYAHDTRILRYKIHDKTPLFIYRNPIDFQQTNIIPTLIGSSTGGFTEAFKNRIAVPATPSIKSLRQVITHEFTHALQYDILYGEGIRSFRVYKGYLIPEWVLEGLAEYDAQDWDSVADMVARDAVLHDRMVPLTLMDGFDHLEDVFLAYKESQLAWQYLAEEYGEDKVAAVFKSFKNQISISQILRETIGIGLNEFSQNYLAWLKQRYWTQIKGKDRPEDYGPEVDPPDTVRLTVTTGAAWSPDGRYLAYISNRDQNFRVYLKARGKSENSWPITSRVFEGFATQSRVLAWSPDSRRIAFVAQEEGKNHLYLVTVTDHNLEILNLPVDDFYSPAWSPDGKTIALTGCRNGVSDIYIWDLEARQLKSVTSDRCPDASPAWSPDGTYLVYSTERDNHWQLARVSVQPAGSPQLLTQGAFEHEAPAFDPDGKGLYYTGDANGIFNLCWLDPDQHVTARMTDIRNGILQPAPSPDGKQLAYTVYDAGSEKINLLTLQPCGDSDTAAYYPIPEEHFSATVADADSSTGQARYRIISSRPYQFRFSPDLLFLLAGYDSSQGVIGGGYLTASDYLGDHTISLISDIVPGYQSQTQLTYLNYSTPVAIGFSANYQRNFYRIVDLETNTLLDEFNDEIMGGGLLLSRPFSLFDRLETELNLNYLHRQYSDNTQQTSRVTSVRLSLIHDDTMWYDFEPANGTRNNFSLVWADQLLGGQVNYSLIQLDSQLYQSLDMISPYLVFGARLLGAASLGPDHPLFIFGGIGVLAESGTIRGYSYGELLGSQILALNLELRFPLARNINYTLWPIDFLLLKDVQAVVFNDVGVVSQNFMDTTPHDVRDSVGLGFRLHTFLLGKQLMTIRFDMAKRTNGYSDLIYTWGIGQAF